MPDMGKAIEFLRKKRVKEEIIRRIAYENPLKILQNKDIRE